MKTFANCKPQIFKGTAVVLLLVVSAAPRAMAQAGNQEALTNDDVVKMVAAHMDESKIVRMIQTQPGNYSLTPGSIEQLKQHGVPAAAIGAMQAEVSSASPNAPASADPAPLQRAASARAPASGSATAKKPGVIRLGIVMPKAQLTQGVQSPAAGESLRVILIQYLNGPAVEAVSIAALLPQQIEVEAQANLCDYLVYSTFTLQKSGGGLGLLRAATSMARIIPMVGGVAAAVGTIAEATTAAQQAASLSNGITAKSQVVMEYHVTASGTPSPVFGNTISAKAKTDGEDIITPLIEQEAAAIMEELTNKQK